MMPWVNFMNMFLPVPPEKIYDAWIDTCGYGLLIPICKVHKVHKVHDPNPGVLPCHQPGVHSLQCHLMSQVRSFSQLSLSFLCSAGVVCGKFGGSPQKLVT